MVPVVGPLLVVMELLRQEVLVILHQQVQHKVMLVVMELRMLGTIPQLLVAVVVQVLSATPDLEPLVVMVGLVFLHL